MADEKVQWYDAWGKLKQIAAQLDQSVASLQANRAFALSRPDLAPAYNAKMAEVESMRSKAIWVRDAIKQAMAYFGVQLQGVSGLGFVPLLVWPAVAGAVAWLGSKALDMAAFAQMVNEQKRLEAQGVAPGQAADLVRRQKEAGSLADAIKSLVPVVVLGVGGLLVWQYLQRRRSS